MGVPGHFSRTEFIGTVRIIHKGQNGRILGLLLTVDVQEPIDIGVLLEQGSWPNDVHEGCRLHVRGRLAQEKALSHRRNVHFLLADFVDVVRPWPARYQERSTHGKE